MVNVIQAALRRLKKSPTDAAIILFSMVAVHTGIPFHASIASAKGAIGGLTRSLAAERAFRIRVNAMAPLLIDAPLAGSLLDSDEKRNASAGRHPLKRTESPAVPSTRNTSHADNKRQVGNSGIHLVRKFVYIWFQGIIVCIIVY